MPGAPTNTCRHCDVIDANNQFSRKKRIANLLYGSPGPPSPSAEDEASHQPRGRSRARAGGRRNAANLVARAKSVMRQQSFKGSNEENLCHYCQHEAGGSDKPSLRHTVSDKRHSEVGLNDNLRGRSALKGLNSRRAKSEVRGGRLKSKSEASLFAPDLNGNSKIEHSRLLPLIYGEQYAEPEDSSTSRRQLQTSSDNNHHKKLVRSKSKSRHLSVNANSGVLTIWPGKKGIWLPQ